MLCREPVKFMSLINQKAERMFSGFLLPLKFQLIRQNWSDMIPQMPLPGQKLHHKDHACRLLLVLFTRCKTPPFYILDLIIHYYALIRKGEPRMKYKKPRPIVQPSLPTCLQSLQASFIQNCNKFNPN
jgi:hypothetical protein